MHQPKQILEVGTAVGFSALLMAANTEMCHITTIEKYEKRIPGGKGEFSEIRYGDIASRCWKAMHWHILQRADRDVRFDISWMQQKGSIFIFCRMTLRLSGAQAVFMISDNVLAGW